MANRQRKIILIGAKGYQRSKDGIKIDCFEWKNINKIRNIKDYDTVILNLLKLKMKKDRENVSWEDFLSVLNFESARDILYHDGSIIVIGDPRFTIIDRTKERKSKQIHEGDIVYFLDWSLINFYWDNKPGNTKIFNNDYYHKKFKEYIKHLEKWNYSLNTAELNRNELETYVNIENLTQKDIDISIDIDNFCCNRYENPLAFSVGHQYLKIVKRYGYRTKKEIIKNFGPIIFLPEISLNEDETLMVVLSDICDVETELPEPEWLKNYNAPGQIKIDGKIEDINSKMDKLLDKVEIAKLERKNIRKCLKLLYEREYALEPATRDILRELGAQVEDPTETNKEDGWISVKFADKIYEGVLEIKSTKSAQFGEEGRKQLLDWIDRGRQLKGKNYKGIFIGNSSVSLLPDERPYAFSDSWKKNAKLSKICAIKTVDLYAVYVLNFQKKINVKFFWEELFNTDGIFNIKSILKNIGI